MCFIILYILYYIYNTILYTILKDWNIIVHDIIINIYYSDGEISSRLLHDELNPESSRKGLVENPNITLNQMFLILFDVLQEYMSFNNVDEKTFSSHQVSTIKNPLIDVNNNNLSVITTRGIKQNCLSADAAENLGNDNCIRAIDRDCIVCIDKYIHGSEKTSDIVPAIMIKTVREI